MSDTKSISSILAELADDVKDSFFGNERQSDLIRISKKYQFRYIKRLYLEELDVELKALSLFRKNTKKLLNILAKKEKGFELLIFDYYLGRISKRKRTSCSLIENNKFDFPHFLVRPKKAGELFKDFFFLQDTILDYRPDFNKVYRIKTNHKNFVNSLISDEIADLMIREKNLHFEGKGNFLLIYKRRNLVPPQDTPALYRFILEFMTLIIESNDELVTV